MGDIGELKLDVVEHLMRKKVTGGHNKTVDTVVNWFASHRQGEARDAIDELVAEPESPVVRYGGQRDAIKLTSIEDAKQYLVDSDRELPWGFER